MDSETPETTATVSSVFRTFRRITSNDQKTVADTIGVHPQSYGSWERGHGLPSADKDEAIFAMLYAAPDVGPDLVLDYKLAIATERGLKVKRRDDAVRVG